MRVLSGIQPSGNPHLGNYLGAIRQHIEAQTKNECIYMIVDLHALTTVRDPQLLQTYTYELIKTYVALGLDIDKTTFFLQSRVPEHAELTWILSCLAPMGLLERAHSWKDAVAKKRKDPSVGLFTYPILMASDILLYKPKSVPVGKDQKQHLEICRDLAQKFNNTYGDVFVLPEPDIREEVAVVPGTDGAKMSKSYGNTIDLFAPEKTLKKQIMSIQTDSTPLEEPKDPSTCNIFALYKLLATADQTANLESKYKAGGMGYGDAKKELLSVVLEQFSAARKKYEQLSDNQDYLLEIVNKGSIKAREMANKTLTEVKNAVGIM